MHLVLRVVLMFLTMVFNIIYTWYQSCKLNSKQELSNQRHSLILMENALQQIRNVIQISF